MAANLGATSAWRQANGAAQGTFISHLTNARRRPVAPADVPRRLADVEHARDALLQPILHHRQKAQEEAEALGAETVAGDMPEHDPDPAGTASGVRERELSARTR
jgi:hypothetical protein